MKTSKQFNRFVIPRSMKNRKLVEFLCWLLIAWNPVLSAYTLVSKRSHDKTANPISIQFLLNLHIYGYGLPHQWAVEESIRYVSWKTLTIKGLITNSKFEDGKRIFIEDDSFGYQVSQTMEMWFSSADYSFNNSSYGEVCANLMQLTETALLSETFDAEVAQNYFQHMDGSDQLSIREIYLEIIACRLMPNIDSPAPESSNQVDEVADEQSHFIDVFFVTDAEFLYIVILLAILALLILLAFLCIIQCSTCASSTTQLHCHATNSVYDGAEKGFYQYI